jgi:diaminopimelate decarboxylase
MKPMGTVPSDFSTDRGTLTMGGLTAEELVEKAGDTPAFVYDMQIVSARVKRLREAMPKDLLIHYAVKANPHPDLVRRMVGLVDGIDVASEGELRLALVSGSLPQTVSFAGPGKRDRELVVAIEAGVTINLESYGEAERALAIGRAKGIRPKLAVRVNPDFDLRGSGMRMGGGAKPFGLDSAEVPKLIAHLLAEGADWRGLHIFAGSQALDPEAISEAQRAAIQLAADLSESAGASPPLVNIGGGFGIPYFPNEQPLNIESIGAVLEESLAQRPAILSDTRVAIELGRWLVGEAGVYLTRVVDRKTSHGETFLVTDGGLHHQLAASGNFGTVVRRNYPVAVAARFGEELEEAVTVVGCLCTPLDRLGDQVMLPRAEVGDLIAVFMAGAYGASASPQAFLGHPPAAEIVVG